ncbi:alpha/beta fold hydrolase [Hungatella sp.]|uniref:alpha/beta fold hydrolase n=1 Tax=Hungatella sp. TaxID=2613924 RepID=UPI003994DD57
MIKRREFRVPSSDGKSGLHTVLWEPDGEVRQLLLISHGMTEHILRYDPFARFLAEQGIAVIGHDHLGHGGTVQNGRSGYFADKAGHVCVIRDLHRTASRICVMYPGRPLYMLGHSMGSFFLRRYLTLYGEELAGAIIMGTGDQAMPIVIAGKLIAASIGLIRGKEYQSKWMHQLVLGNYNRSFMPSRTDNDWLSKNCESVDQYCSDPFCNFKFTASAYCDFFNIMLDLKLHRQEERIPRSLPLFILSGAQDPVGEFGRGVRRVFRRYKKIGMTDTEMILYPDDRHELLNETDKEAVWHDILSWITYHEL